MRERPLDVLVVGRGAIGLSIAFELAQRAPTLRIGILGRSEQQGSASHAAGAMLNTFAEVGPSTLSTAAGRAKLELCIRALDRWDEWLARLEASVQIGERRLRRVTGTSVLHNTRSGRIDDDSINAIRAALIAYDEPFEILEAADIPGVDAAVDARPLRAIHIPREGAIDARHVLDALSTATDRGGVRSITGTAVKVAAEGDRVAGVVLADGSTIRAERVVLAAGVETENLLDGMLEPGSIPLLYAGKGNAALVKRTDRIDVDHVVRTPNRSGSCGLHVIPIGDSRYYLGASNVLSRQATTSTDLGMSQLLIRSICEQIDRRLFHAGLERWLVGNRPVTVDGFPLIGETTVTDLFIATGTYRDGFHTAPEIARLVVDHLLGIAALSSTVSMFAPERAPIQTQSRSESVNTFAAHGVAATVEANARLPENDTTMVEYFHRSLINVFYEDLPGELSFSPEIVAATMSGEGKPHAHLLQYVTNVARRWGAATSDNLT